MDTINEILDKLNWDNLTSEESKLLTSILEWETKLLFWDYTQSQSKT